MLDELTGLAPAWIRTASDKTAHTREGGGCVPFGSPQTQAETSQFLRWFSKAKNATSSLFQTTNSQRFLPRGSELRATELPVPGGGAPPLPDPPNRHHPLLRTLPRQFCTEFPKLNHDNTTTTKPCSTFYLPLFFFLA